RLEAYACNPPVFVDLNNEQHSRLNPAQSSRGLDPSHWASPQAGIQVRLEFLCKAEFHWNDMSKDTLRGER
ncbi:MAG: hypothetical protein WCC81_05370, partial [Pseudolabrys sp.]